MNNFLDAAPLRSVSDLFDKSIPMSKWRGKEGAWIGNSCVVRVKKGPTGRWMILEGNFFESIDQLTDARAVSAGRRLLLAYSVNLWEDVGSWGLGFEIPDDGHVELVLPYVIRKEGGLFCTGYRLLLERPPLTSPRLVFPSFTKPHQSDPADVPAAPMVRAKKIVAAPVVVGPLGSVDGGPTGDGAPVAVRSRIPTRLKAAGNKREAILGAGAFPLMQHRRKGMVLGDVQLEHDVAIVDNKIVFSEKGGAGRFSRPLRLIDRNFVAGDTLVFRPVINGPTGQGIAMEILDPDGVRLSCAEIAAPKVGRSQSTRFRCEIAHEAIFVYLVIASLKDNIDPVIVGDLKCQIDGPSGVIVQTNRIFS